MANSTIGLDCLQQNKGDTDLSLLGTIMEKITVSANNDSYEATRTRMAQAEKERKGNRLEYFSKLLIYFHVKNHSNYFWQFFPFLII